MMMMMIIIIIISYLKAYICAQIIHIIEKHLINKIAQVKLQYLKTLIRV